MSSQEAQRTKKHAATDQERRAFERQYAAWLALDMQSKPFAAGVPDDASIKEFGQAEKEWRSAIAASDRIADEIRNGKRR